MSQDLRDKAIVIQNETIEGANTANRVGSWMVQCNDEKVDSGGSIKTLQQLDDEKAEATKLNPNASLQHPTNLYYIGGYGDVNGNIWQGDINLHKTSGFIPHKLGDRIKIKGAERVVDVDSAMANGIIAITKAAMSTDFVVYTFPRDGYHCINYEFSTGNNIANKVGDVNKILVGFYPVGADIVENKVDKVIGSRLINSDEVKSVECLKVTEQSSTNLLNPNSVLFKTMLNEIDGSFTTTGAGFLYDTFVFVKVKPNTLYKGLKNDNTALSFRKGGFLTENKVYIADSGFNSLTEFTTSADASYVHLSVANSTGDFNLRNLGLFEGSSAVFESYKGNIIELAYDNPYEEKTDASVVAKKDIAPIDAKATNALTLGLNFDNKIKAFDIVQKENVSPNLMNPQAREHQVLVNEATGGKVTSGAAANYDSWFDIEIEPNTYYKGLTPTGIQSFRKTAFLTADGVFISGIGTAVTDFTTPANARRVSVSVANNIADYNPVYVGLFKGSDAVWSPFGDNYSVKINTLISTEDKSLNEAATIQDVKNLVDSGGGSTEVKPLSFSIASSVITFNHLIGTIQGYVKENRGYNGNNMFNFYRFDLNGIGTANGDDAAPTHSMGTTIGANHGQGYNRVTIASHGKTNANKGEEWIQGSTKFYIMNVISTSQIDFLSENKGTKASPVFINMQEGAITRGNETLTVTAKTGRQLYPSIKNLNLNVLDDGFKLISGDGDYSANHVDIVENYDIMSTDSTLQKVIASAGTSGAPVYDGDSMIRIENIYRFFPYPSVVGLFNAIILDNIAFNDFMFSQAAKISTSLTPYYYVPNSLANASYDFRKPIQETWDGSKPQLFFDSSMWTDQNNPVNRIIQYVGNLGFAFGFIPTIGVGKSLKDFTNRTFEIRNNTGKVYPHGVEGSKVGNTLSNGDAFSCGMYRCYMDLTKVRTDNRLSYYYYEIDNELHLWVDYSSSVKLDHINLDMPKLNGRKVEVIQSSNTILKTTIYNNGIYINADYVEGETCFVCIKIY